MSVCSGVVSSHIARLQHLQSACTARTAGLQSRKGPNNDIERFGRRYATSAMAPNKIAILVFGSVHDQHAIANDSSRGTEVF